MPHSVHIQRRRVDRLAFTASPRPEAQAAMVALKERYGHCDEADADVVVAIGGDGHMLEVLRRHMDDGVPVYGVNRGTVGFLMNDVRPGDLAERISGARASILHPLLMHATDINGQTHQFHAINEVSLLRQTHQAVRLRIAIDGEERIDGVSCDGIIVATPAGSTAYNYSAHGPILPIGCGLLALTPISVFRPRRWRGAILRHQSLITIHVDDPHLRPIAASADAQEVRDVRLVSIHQDQTRAMTMLSDHDRPLDERMMMEQFAT